MSIWKWIGVAYLAISVVILLSVFITLVREDIRMYREPWRRNTSKFGYNLIPNGPASVWGLGWWMLAGCLPGINLVVAAFFLICAASNYTENRRMERE